jgi:hypothetical protein
MISRKTLYIFISVPVVLVYFLFVAIFLWTTTDAIKGKIVEKVFWHDIKKYRGVHVEQFAIWEGDGIATLSIAQKGRVSFWYGVDMIPRIESVAQYSTSFDCFYADSKGKKLSYAYSANLDLGKDTQFKKWFPFQVNSLKDLLNHYEDIVAVVNTFPKNPELVKFRDIYGERMVLKNSHTNFVINTKLDGRAVTCDLYFLTH